MMKKTRLLVLTALLGGGVLMSTSANAFMGPFNPWNWDRGWGGYGPYGYPGYGYTPYGYGYPGWGAPGYGYSPYGYAPYGAAYPYAYPGTYGYPTAQPAEKKSD